LSELGVVLPFSPDFLVLGVLMESDVCTSTANC
jgi:hypothetical protein